MKIGSSIELENTYSETNGLENYKVFMSIKMGQEIKNTDSERILRASIFSSDDFFKQVVIPQIKVVFPEHYSLFKQWDKIL